MSKRKITVIPGDGIGPSIIESAIQILTHAGCDLSTNTLMRVWLPSRSMASCCPRLPWI